ncbi:hypothetical protein ACFL2D_00150 [Patescibacteria group bacterium]
MEQQTQTINNKEYPRSKSILMTQFFFKKPGAVIQDGKLSMHAPQAGIPSTENLPIENINGIYFGLEITKMRIEGMGAPAPMDLYKFTTKDGHTHLLHPANMHPNTVKELIRDLLSINPKILLGEKVAAFLKRKIPSQKFSWDYTTKRKKFWKRHSETEMDRPAMDTLVGLMSGLLLIFAPFGSVLVGAIVFDADSGIQIFLLIVSGLAFGVGFMNAVFLPLLSQYFGHIVTASAFALTLVLYLVAILL